MRLGRSARPAVWGLALGLAVGACGGSPSRSPSPTSPGADQPPALGGSVTVTTSACPPTARLDEGLPERQGAGAGATLWALFFPTQPLLTAGKEIKVAWRMTGQGALSMSAEGPDGTVVQPVWGPEPHGSSNWIRPGDEWGTGWTFPSAGCWTIRADRAMGSGYLVLRVAG